jgi:hypothetical protein
VQKTVVERRLALSRAIERSYDVFAAYDGPGELEFCEHCHDDACAPALRATALRDLDAGQVRCLTYAASLDPEPGADLRYVLPRLLELLPAGEPLEPEVVLSKPAAAGWRSWPLPEQEALEAFAAAYWDAVLAEFPGAVRAEDALCGLALLTAEVAPYLATWTDDVQASAIRHCARIINTDLAECLASLRPLQLSGPYWMDCQAAHQHAVAWLLEEGRLATFEAAAHADDDPDTVAELSRAFEVLALALKTAPPESTE